MNFFLITTESDQWYKPNLLLEFKFFPQNIKQMEYTIVMHFKETKKNIPLIVRPLPTLHCSYSSAKTFSQPSNY